MDQGTKEALLFLLDEAYASEKFENTWFKDNEPASSILPLLDHLTVEQALETGCGRNPAAAHAQHLAMALEGTARAARGGPFEVDWEGSWILPQPFGEEEWSALRTRLRAAYEDVTGGFRQLEDISDPNLSLGGLALLAHSTFHLGALRQIAHQHLPHD